MKITGVRLLILSLLGGFFLFLGWPPKVLFIFLFIGFAPFILIEHLISKKGEANSNWQVLKYTYPGFVFWNALTTWWLFNASPVGCLFAILANALFMSAVIILYHITKKQLGKGVGYLSLIIYWITFEYLHHNWELAWTWLSLGNGLGSIPILIQWYEYTGMLGGTLWILSINWLVFLLTDHFLFQKYPQAEQMSGRTNPKNKIISLALLILIPALISILIYNQYEEKGKEIEVVIVQPNIDPYNEKFPEGKDFIPFRDQIDRFLILSAEHVKQSTEYLVWPETALPGGMDVENMNRYGQVEEIRQFMQSFPNLKLVAGIDGFEIYGSSPKTATSRLSSDGITWYDAFNTAIQIDSTEVVQYYHKSKLVPGVERMPYPQVFRFLENLSLNMGGISGSLGTQDKRSVFNSNKDIKIAPVVCFESVFGEYVGGYIRNGANAIFVITNDGWWGNTPGYKQHLTFSSIRAIEHRRSVARSANTGTSCYVNQKGMISQATPYWVQASIKGHIRLNDELTFYTKNGDLLGRVAGLLSIIALLISLVSGWTNKFYFRKTG